MDTTRRLCWGTTVLSVPALFLNACGDDDADDAAAEETESPSVDT